jgi:hypothetical protein
MKNSPTRYKIRCVTMFSILNLKYKLNATGVRSGADSALEIEINGLVVVFIR